LAVLQLLLLLALNKVGEAGTTEMAVAACFDWLIFPPFAGFTTAAVTSDEAVVSTVLTVTAANVTNWSAALPRAARDLLLCISCWRSFSSKQSLHRRYLV
jgi:hypothetical protein